jgi:hypothetical protein
MLMDLNIENETSDLLKYKLFLTNLRTMNARKPLDLYRTYVYPHKSFIMKGDERYFMDLNFVTQSGGGKRTMLKALALREIWQSGNLSEKQKHMIKQYMKALLLLSERCS